MDNKAKIGGQKKNHTNKASIKISSFNVRGLRNVTKRDRVLRHMKDNYPGILFLQETRPKVMKIYGKTPGTVTFL
jgi:hypothetical protein